jgi:hypothetical protein
LRREEVTKLNIADYAPENRKLIVHGKRSTVAKVAGYSNAQITGAMIVALNIEDKKAANLLRVPYFRNN